MKKRILSAVLGIAMVATLLVGCGSGSSDDSSKEDTKTEDTAKDDSGEKTAADYKIAVVPKMTNLAWFERMEQGVDDYNETNGTSVEYCGSPEGDGQAAFVEGLISQGYDAICVVPFDVEALDPVLAKAKDAGIVVICHEASTVENMDYDVEAFDTLEYGAHLMEKINELSDGKGRVIQTVGALTSQSHVEEAQGGKEWAEKNAPDLKVDDQPIVSDDNQDTAYSKVKEALTADTKHEIVGIQCAAMSETPGAAQAVEELGLQGKVHIAGTSLMSVCGEYVEDGTVELMSFWGPALAGQSIIAHDVATLNGTVGEDTLSLPVEGYENLTLEGKVYTGSAWIDVDKDNCNDEAYDF